MRNRLFVAVTTAVMAVSLLVTQAPPAGAASSGYEMFGGGTLNFDPGSGHGGIPFCPLFCDPTAVSTFSFASLPIQGAGMLLGAPVAGQYGCPSHGTIVGDTTNFHLRFDFQCSLTAGVGPSEIDGYFETLQDGVPVFAGKFSTADGTVDSTCVAGFAPSAFDNPANPQVITAAQFGGECTSVAA